MSKDNWSITSLKRDLFPGGPSAYEVKSPYGTFYFGMHVEPPFKDPCSAIITSFGIKGIKTIDRVSIFTDEFTLEAAKNKVREILSTNPLDYHYKHFTGVEFSSGSGTIVEIF